MADNHLYAISCFTLNLAMQAGEIMSRERSHATLEHSYKNNEELVTNADIKVDQFISKQLKRNFPDHIIVSEEENPDLARMAITDQPMWIVDPIDGTVNYAHGQFHSAVSIAYVEQGEVKVGVVHCPFLNETFSAIKGVHSVMNHKPIHVSDTTALDKALIATGFPYHKEDTGMLTNRLSKVLANCQDIRRLGSAAMDICWVAMGRLDGYYESLKPWDFAAARLVAAEAGAVCGHFSAVPEGIPAELFGDDIIIANPHIYEPLRSLLVD
ncbi:MAG: inositol monophosphatase [Gammaproteobacteria bacterium]|nr:MAG: inositol monophosphatase [Pseudomonadota bacterium]PIE38835.1 MAG: inositol monophosphatase [Gammaproteobacteria bacterium]